MLFAFYRVLGVALLALAVFALAEKYRTVRGATLYDARVLRCERASDVLDRRGAGGYCYWVEVYTAAGRRECQTNDSFFFDHSYRVGQAVKVWYNPAAKLVERKSPGTELLAVGMALVGVALLLIR